MSARYHAPAVAYEFDRPGWAGWALLLSWAVLVAALGGWCQAAHWHHTSLLMSGGVLLLAALLLIVQWCNWPKGSLLWNGEHWQLRLDPQEQMPEQPVQLRLGLDGGSWLWLSVCDQFPVKSFKHKRKVLWILMRQRHSPVQWGDLRRAVYSSVVLLAEQG